MGPQLELHPLEDGWDRPAVGAPSPWGRLGWGFLCSSRPLEVWEGAPFRPGRTSNSNAVSVAIPQPRVAGEARYPGYPPHQPCNAVSVAISRRRYPQRGFHGFGTFDNFPLRVTPTANRNSFRVALSFIIVPRVEALRTSTLGYEIATPTELPRVHTILSPYPADTHTPRTTNPSHPTDSSTHLPTNSVQPVTIATIFLMTSAKIMTISTKFLMTSTNFLATSATLETTSTNILTTSTGSYRPKRVSAPSETCVRAV